VGWRRADLSESSNTSQPLRTAARVLRFELKAIWVILDGALKDFIETPNFTITDCGDGSFWIQRPDGEGMQVSKEKFDQMIEQFYNANF
jgi:hypothetical protein